MSQLEQQVSQSPTFREFVGKLSDWGFTQRKYDGVHIVFRGPAGGTVRVLKSLIGRPDPALVAKAAQLVGVDVEQFWAGPAAMEAAPRPRTRAARRSEPNRDRITSLVLSAHVAADRPLGFDQVVELCGGKVSRSQVRTASSVLCREGDLDRIRSGMYQWAGGTRAAQRPGPIPPPRELQLVVQPQPAEPPQLPPTPTASAATQSRRVVELFDQIFPGGVRMTAELWSDFEQWAQLTDKLIEHAKAS